MAPLNRRTKVEELGVKHPGLQEFVEERIRSVTYQKIAEAVLEQWGEELSPQVISNHYLQRVWPEDNLDAEAIREGYKEAAIIMRLAAENPNQDDAKMAKVLLAQAIVLNKRKLSDADPLKVMTEQRRWVELEQRNKEIEIEQGKLAAVVEEQKFRLAQFEAQQEQAKEAIEEAENKLGRGASLTIIDINRIRERVFGLPAIAGGHPALPVSTEVGG
jgi:hypothetical protein